MALKALVGLTMQYLTKTAKVPVKMVFRVMVWQEIPKPHNMYCMIYDTENSNP